jgi:hypothetical protein
MGSLIILVAGLLILATALASLLGVTQRRTFARGVVVLNTIWVLVVSGGFAWILYQLFQAF